MGWVPWRADYKPQDNQITLTDWLSYGVERVPQILTRVVPDHHKSFANTFSAEHPSNQLNSFLGQEMQVPLKPPNSPTFKAKVKYQMTIPPRS